MKKFMSKLSLDFFLFFCSSCSHHSFFLVVIYSSLSEIFCLCKFKIQPINIIMQKIFEKWFLVWAGVAVVGLMLFSLGARQEILRQLRWRRIHVAANLLVALLFVIQGITGTRDLLEIPLRWQNQ